MIRALSVTRGRIRSLVPGVVAGLLLGVLGGTALPVVAASPAAAAATLGQPLIGDPVTVTGFGSATGGSAASSSCAPYAVTALTGYQHVKADPGDSDGDWLDGLAPTCSPVLSDGSAASVGDPADGPVFGRVTTRPTAATACPAGAVATGVQARSGSLVDQLRLICSPLGADGTLGAASPAATAIGGAGGSPVTPDRTCPAGSVVTGLTGRTGASIDFLSLVCRSLLFDRALRFQGGTSTSRVAAPAQSGLTTDFTLAADVRWDGSSTGRRGILSQPRRDDANGRIEGWSLVLEDGRPCLRVNAGATAVMRALCAATALPAGRWVHVEGSYTGSVSTLSVAGATTTREWGSALGVSFPLHEDDDEDEGDHREVTIGRIFRADPDSAFGGDLDEVTVAAGTGSTAAPVLHYAFNTVSTSGATPGTPGGAGVLTGVPLPQSVVRDPADTEPDNLSWPTAQQLTSGTPVQGALLRPGEARWYRIPVHPDAGVQVDLTDLPADYDLTVFTDIGQAFTTLTSTADLTKLSAEFAGDAFAPSVFSPSVFSPSVFSPSVFSPSVFSPSVFSPSVFSPSVFSPSVFSPSVFSPSVFSPSVFSPSVFSPSVFSPSVFSPSVFSPSVFSPSVFSDAFSSAQTRSLVAVSARDGLADESARTQTWGNTGSFYIRVVGRGGASSPAPFTLRASVSGGACGALSTFSGTATLTGTPGAARTVVLTDLSRFSGDTAALTQKLDALAAATDGVVVNLADSPRVAALNAQADAQKACPYAKNLVAQAAREIVNSYRGSGPGGQTLTYVVLAGGDSVVPFFRYPDTSGLGPENGYVPPVADDTASQASLRRNTFLSQDAYGAATDLTVKGTTLPVPDLAVGRLVETPAEISGTVDDYLTTRSTRPVSSLTTGYDFLTDAADAVAGTLADGIGGSGNEQLVTDQAVPPSTTTVNGTPDRQHSWTADDLRTRLLTRRHDVTFLAGHFSANSALAADYSSQLVTTELASAPAGTFRNTLVVSAGCHSGYNLLDADGVPGLTLGLDWAQAFAQQGATLVAGTGYQYGDTDFLEYSERLYAGFFSRLREGDAGTPVALGTALADAKQRYLADTPALRGIHVKALLEATLFGLPMRGIDLPNRVPAPAAATGVTPAVVGGGPGVELGLRAAPLTVTAATTPNDRPLTSTDGSTVHTSYLSGPDGVVTNPGEPVLPLQTVDVTAPGGQVLRGVGWRGGHYADTGPVVPLTGAPATELNAAHAPFVSSAFYPSRLATPNYFGALTDPAGGRTTLAVTPAQYRSSTPGSTSSTERRYQRLDYELFYSSNTTTYSGNVPALAAPPSMSGVHADLGSTAVPVSVHVVGDPSAGVQKVWVTYTGVSGTPLNGDWTSVDLTQDGTDSTLWAGSIPLPPGQSAADVRFLVQAVNGVGVVGADDNGGDYYTPGATDPVTTTAQAPSALLVDGPATVATGDPATVTATLTGGGAGLAGRSVTVSLGASSATGTTDPAGQVTLTLPVNDLPGDATLQASWDGDPVSAADPSAGFGPATSPVGSVTVTRRATTLTLAGTPATVTPGAPSGVSARLLSTGLPVRNHTVWFTVTDGQGTVVAGAARITGADGTAELGTVASTGTAGPGLLVLPTGDYTVSASFGGTVALPGGGSTSLADPVLGPSSTDPDVLKVGRPPTISGTPPAGTALSPYSFAFTLDGAPAPTVAVTAGTLPDGLTLSPAGLLAGTPTRAGSFPLTVTATNGVAPAASTSFTLVIAPPPPAAVVAVSGSGQTGVTGLPFDAPLRARVDDAAGRPMAGVAVTFTVTTGSAGFGAGGTPRTATATTDSTGVATSPALVAGGAAGPVTVTATAGPATAATFTGTVVTTANARADLAVTLTGVPASAARGSSFTATVTVKNLGPNTAGKAITGLTIGSGLTLVSAPGSTLVLGVPTWTSSPLPVNGTLTFTATVRVSATRAGSSTLAAASASLVPDPKLANNAVTASVKIT